MKPTVAWNVVACCAAVFAAACAHAAPDEIGDALWQDVAETSAMRAAPRSVVPLRYRTLTLDTARLSALLAGAPDEARTNLRSSDALLSLPLPDGTYAQFRIVESPILQDGLAAKYPGIRTYLGQGVTDPTASVRFDVTPSGFHAQILASGKAFYVDPYRRGDTRHYVSYDKRDYAPAGKSLQCGVKGDPAFAAAAGMLPAPRVSSGGTLRTYRLATSATGEYTQVQGGTVADALAGIVTTINRVNGIYERELAVRLVLVNDTDLSIYTDGATDPFTDTDALAMLEENQQNLDSLIGTANYDIGHVFSAGGGGLASPAPCGSTKAHGVTGSGSPYGDPFDVDFVAHEMGHQFGAPHTYNSVTSNCEGYRTAWSAYEPGGGVTIMAYAGLCGEENIQPNSEDFFHRGSLTRILSSINGHACRTSSASGNTPPTVKAPAGYTIPARTPFTLTASGADADSDALTYVWEQLDVGEETSGGPLVDDGARPLFRSFDTTTNPSRTFPSLRYILNNANIVPTAAPLPGTTAPLRYTGELLPTTDRTLNFRVTVRDNRAGGGGTNEASTALAVVGSAGPFAVTAPNSAVSWAAGSTQTVTWNVAGTAAPPIATADVAIALSLDGGYSWPVVLTPATPNNGSATVVIPAGTPATTQGRIKVSAVGNVYFDISGVNFAITSPVNTAPAISVPVPITVAQGSPAVSADVATVSDTQDAAVALTVALSQLPAELTASVVNNAGTVRITAQAACTLTAPVGSSARIYPVLLSVADSAGATTARLVSVSVRGNATPTLGTYARQILTRGVGVSVAPTAPPADANNNLVGTSVSPTVLPGGGTVSVAQDGTVGITTTAATGYGYHPIRVSAVDACGAVEMRQFVAQVTTAEPLLNFRDATVGSGNALIEPGECNAATVALINEGASTASAIASTLTTTTPGVTITQPVSPYPDLAAAASGTNAVAYEIGTSPALACYSTIDFTQTLTYAGGGSPRSVNFSLPVGRASGAKLEFVASSGAAITPGGTRVAGSAGIDDARLPLTVPAGFDFSMAGRPVAGGSTILAGTNGTLQFATPGGSAASSGTAALPANGPVLFVYRDDLTTTGTGNGIYTELAGAAPNRTWKIEWRAVARTSAAPVNFAAIFRENSAQFDLVYASVAAANGDGATVGWQDGRGFAAYMHDAAAITDGTRLTGSPAPAVCTVGPGSCTVDLIFRNGFEL